MSKRIEWDVAEVLEYDYTYQYVPETEPNPTTNKLFALRVRSCSTYFNDKVYIARPSNINMKQIPLVGEFVLIYKTFNQESTTDRWRESWYYVSSIDIQSSINENMLPGLSNSASQEQIDETKPGKTFVKRTISPIQPFEGDFLIEGRFGNSIRFGSSVNTTNAPAGYYTKSATWNSSEDSSPIIILSNGHENLPGKEFVVENIERDSSSLYLTSTQQLDKLKLSTPLTVNNNFVGSQLIGAADRIILRAKTDIVVIDAEKEIVLNTPGNIKLGDDSADQSMVHGEVLIKILNKLARAIMSGGTAQGSIVNTNTPTLLTDISADLSELMSKKYKIKKT
jgi:hypothetical protein